MLANIIGCRSKVAGQSLKIEAQNIIFFGCGVLTTHFVSDFASL
jgi:hypothetical protein